MKPLLILFVYAALAGSLLSLNSCMCSCHCNKNLGCMIVTAKSNASGNIVASQLYCTQSDISYEIDNAVQDSVKSFGARYPAPDYYVTSRDSVTSVESAKKLSCKESERYKRKGYYCVCAK